MRVPSDTILRDRADGERGVLVHVTTVPMSLMFLSGQATFMREEGYRVHAVSSPGSELARFAEKERVSAHAVPMHRRITPLRDLATVWQLRKLLRAVGADIIHSHTPKGGLLGMIAGCLARTPVRVYHMRGLPFVTARGYRRLLLRATERTACALAHRVIAVSHSLRDVAVEEGLCHPEKITVLLGGSGNGVDATGRFQPLPPDVRRETRARHGIPDDAIVLGFVGRLVRDKGVVELANAWHQLKTRHPNLHVLIVGPAEVEDAVPSEVVASLQRDSRVHFTGLDWDTPRLYAAMDVVALPTYREGFPNVPLEAAAMKLPIVATKIPGCVDAVRDGETGTLVPTRDADALCAAISLYVADADLRSRHGAAGRARVLRDFRRESIWKAIAAEYDQLQSARGAPCRH